MNDAATSTREEIVKEIRKLEAMKPRRMEMGPRIVTEFRIASLTESLDSLPRHPRIEEIYKEMRRYGTPYSGTGSRFIQNLTTATDAELGMMSRMLESDGGAKRVYEILSVDYSLDE